MSKCPRLSAALAVLAVSVLLAGAAQAQYGRSAPADPAVPDLFSATADSLTVLVDYRTEEEIQEDLSNAVRAQSLAVQRQERARMLETLAETRIKLKEVEMTSLDAQIDLARNAKNELLKKELETRKKFAESEKQLLERRRDLRSRDISVAGALKEYHEAHAKVSQIELQLATRRRQRAALGAAINPALSADFQRLQQEITSLEEKVLNAQIEEANKWKTVADQEARLVRIRKAVFQSQNKVARGG